MTETIRVLVVDDSLVMRKLLTDIIETAPDMEVIGTARNGVEAVEDTRRLDPDVITMDIEMPKMDGLAALQRIMEEKPLPVIMLSAMGKRQADITMKALDIGAVDFISKPSGELSLDIDKISETILKTIRMASKVNSSSLRRKKVVPAPIIKSNFLKPGFTVIAIGASTGGPKALPEVLSRLPRDIPAAILVVQHMPAGFTDSFAERLNWCTSLEVREAKDGDRLEAGVVLIAPGDQHMEVDGRSIRLNKGPTVNFTRPSVDVLMSSVAKNYGPDAIGVIMTGMGHDGAEGMGEIKKNGGRTIAQNKETSIVYGMPGETEKQGFVDVISPLKDIAGGLLEILEEASHE